MWVSSQEFQASQELFGSSGGGEAGVCLACSLTAPDSGPAHGGLL